MASLVQKYFRLLDKKPLQVKIVSAFAIFPTADVIAQMYENHRPNMRERFSTFDWDYLRTVRVLAFGCTITTYIHFWWGWIEVFAEKYVISASKHHYLNAFSKVFIDQAIGSPVFNTVFFASQSLLQGKSLGETKDILVKRVPDMLKLHYCFWPWIHCVNFAFVPLHVRVPVQNLFQTGWMAFLSNKNKQWDEVEVELQSL